MFSIEKQQNHCSVPKKIMKNKKKLDTVPTKKKWFQGSRPGRPGLADLAEIHETIENLFFWNSTMLFFLNVIFLYS